MLIPVQRMEITWQLIMKKCVATCVYIIMRKTNYTHTSYLTFFWEGELLISCYLLHSCSYVCREIPMALPIICGSKLLPSKYDTIAYYIGRLLHEVKVLK